jgi:hypothetical protein
VARLVGIECPGAAGGALQCIGDAAHALPNDNPRAVAEITQGFVAELAIAVMGGALPVVACSGDSTPSSTRNANQGC